MTPEELNTALDIAGERLIEDEHDPRRRDDAVTLLRMLREMMERTGPMTFWLRRYNGSVHVRITGHRGSKMKAERVCRRLLAEEGFE
jgi:hypothetical protein